MRKKSLPILLTPLIVLGAGAVRLDGQIDNRVNRGNTDAAGRVLDRSPQVGSSGFNVVRPSALQPGAYSGAVITGNVSGLAGFHDLSPVVHNNQFRDTLPSSSLSGFVGRSVGLQDVGVNRVPQAGYYYGAAETISDAGYIRRGLNAPGTSKVRDPQLTPPEVREPRPANQELLNALREPGDVRVGIGTAKPGADLYPGRLTPAPLNKRTDGGYPAYSSAVGSSLFGIPNPSDSREEATTSGSPFLSGASLSDGLASSSLDPPILPLAEDPASRRIDTLVLPPLDTAEATDGSQGQTIPELFGMRRSAEGAAENQLPQAIATPANLGQDRFADLYTAVGLAEQFGVRRLGPAAWAEEPVLESPPGTPVAEPEARTRGGLRQTSPELKELTAAAKWASDVIEDPLKTFAGAYQSELNKYMAMGEEALAKGEFYAAARAFDLARTIDPVNPLPLIGRGHALLAAGDYMSALHALQRGIERFPQIAAFRLDLPALVGQSDVFDLRRADLEQKLSTADNYGLRFLLGYIELYSGLADEGLTNLRLAAEAAPKGDIIGLFAGLVTGEQEFPPLQR